MTDPSAASPSPSSTPPDRGVMFRTPDGVLVVPGIPATDSSGHVALASANTTPGAYAMAARVAASARSTPRPVGGLTELMAAAQELTTRRAVPTQQGTL
ncbi:hypothetical protein [Sinomonas soli]